MQGAEITRMVQTVGGKGGALLEKAATETVDRCMSTARDLDRPWYRMFPGMVLNMLLNGIGMNSACDDGVCTVSSGGRTHTVLSGSKWRDEWAGARDGTHVVTLYHDGRVPDGILRRCKSGRLHLYVQDYVRGLGACAEHISALPSRLGN